MCSAVVRDSSVSVNITRPDWLNTHMEFPAAHSSCVNYAKDLAAIFSTLFREIRETSLSVTGPR